MSLQQNIDRFRLEEILKEKQDLFDKMLRENKSFEEVKILFREIRMLEKKLEHPQAINSVVNSAGDNGVNQIARQ